MRDRIKRAFNEVKASDEIKENTKAAIFVNMRKGEKSHKFKVRQIVPAFACLLFMFVGVRYIYFVPTTEISIDINPSIEIGINRFDKVVSVKGYNEDGEKLAAALEIKHLDYQSAVDEIMESDKISALLESNYDMTIAVVGSDGKQTEKVLTDMKSCTKTQKNIECYQADKDDVEDAHNLGLSYGKYRAYQNLLDSGYDITVEEIKDMTMKEIHDLTSCTETEPEGVCNSKHSHHGKRKNQ